MDISQSIYLGIIQGLTEWLPISSSGHLVLANEWFGLDMSVAFGVMLHFATALVIIIMFREDVKSILQSVINPKPTSEQRSGPATQNPNKKQKESYWSLVKGDPYAMLGWWIVIGSLPIAVIGFVFYDIFKGFFDSVNIVGIALIGTGIILLLSASVIKTAHKKQLSALDAYAIGFGQALALIPGISRSGITIGLGLIRNIEGETAAKFSILLAVPAIIGAAIWEFPGIFQDGTSNIEPIVLLVGALTAFIVGYIAIKMLLFVVKKAGFHYFAFYCFGIAFLIMATA